MLHCLDSCHADFRRAHHGPESRKGGVMLGKLGRLIFRITLFGMVLGAVTAALGLGAIAVSEFLSRRKMEEEDDFDDYALPPLEAGAPQELDDDFLSLLACPV